MIQLNGVYKEYKTGNTVTEALSNVSLEIDRGEFAAVMGTSGSGKSTLLNIIGCMDKPSRGEYMLNGRLVSSLSDRELSVVRNQSITFVFQHFALMEKYTAFENIALPLLKRRMPKSARRKIVTESAEMMGVGDQLRKLPKQMSGGQQQRIAIARALASGADIILADEPTGALDQKNSEELMLILKRLNDTGKTVILVTHDADVAKYAQRTIFITDGRIANDVR